MERLFYFYGRAGDLPLALLRHETAELKKLNAAIGYKLAKPFTTLTGLVAAAQINDDDPERRANRSRIIRNIITRPN